ncbi:MAG TPA: biopolymer transporter ExbD [Candidatus Angelobacter sp.]|jgi:biopolymer transport protein ExbD/biopolymer transport protein TolR|nr:biopolymer transporter ExbD [Candidatus Angelobacter sp.]
MAAPRSKASKVNSNINVTPMVDVMLVLLIIFMVITPMLQPGTPVDLAKTLNPIEMPDATRPDVLMIALAHDGKIFLDNEIVTNDALTQRVKDQMTNRANRTVYVRADARTRYKFLVAVVDDVRSAGVDQLGLLTEQIHRSSLP